MYYPVMNVTQCEGQLSTYHLNGGSMTTPQSEGKKFIKKKKLFQGYKGATIHTNF